MDHTIGGYAYGCAPSDALQKALKSLAVRHAATTSTLHMQFALAQAALAMERRQSTCLHTEHLTQETYGWRCEIMHGRRT